MIHKRPADEITSLAAEVAALHGADFQYVHTVEGIGPDGCAGRVDVFDNGKRYCDEARTVHVLNGAILNPC